MEDTEKKSSNKRTVILIAVTLILIICFGLLVGNIDKFHTAQGDLASQTAEDAQEAESSESTTKRPTGFPVSFTSDDIIDIKIIGSRVFVLTNKLLTCISSSGKTEYEVILNFANPVMKAGTKYGIVYDRISGKYKIFSRYSVIHEGQNDDSKGILTADINDSGSYAIASRGDGMASVLSFFDKNGTLKYKWACTKESIICVSVAQNNRYLACASLTSSKGSEVTKIYCLDITSKETKNEYSLSSCAVCDLYFDGNDTIIVSANDRRVVYDTDKEKGNPKVSDYSGDALMLYSDGDGMTAVVTEKFGALNTKIVTLYSKNNEIIYTFETEKKVFDVVCDGKKTYILTQNSIIKLSTRGTDTEIIKLDDTENGFAVSGTNIYHYALGYLFKN